MQAQGRINMTPRVPAPFGIVDAKVLHRHDNEKTLQYLKRWAHTIAWRRGAPWPFPRQSLDYLDTMLPSSLIPYNINVFMRV